MQAQTGRAQRPILNRLTLSLGLAVVLATTVVVAVAALEIDLPFIDEGESRAISQPESRVPATAKTAWDYGDVEADLNASAGAAQPRDMPATVNRPANTSANRGDHRATTLEMGGVLYLDDQGREVGPYADSAPHTWNHRFYDLNAAGAQDPGTAGEAQDSKAPAPGFTDF